MRIFFLKIFLIVTFLTESVLAETLKAALEKAYKNNPELNAERESINISEQELKVSKSSYLPSITLEGSQSEEETSVCLLHSDGNHIRYDHKFLHFSSAAMFQWPCSLHLYHHKFYNSEVEK